jgi:hypothetical protein
MDEKKTIQILQMTSKEHNNNNKKKKKNVFIPASVEVLTTTQKSCRGAGSKAEATEHAKAMSAKAITR